MKLWKKSLMGKLIISFLFPSILIVSLVAIMAYDRANAVFKREIFTRLNILAEVKENAVDRWIEEHRQTVIWTTQLYDVKYQLPLMLQYEKGDAQYKFSHSKILNTLENVIRNKPSLQEIFILTEEGKVIVSTAPEREGENCAGTEHFEKGKEATVIQNVYISPHTGEPIMTIATPLLSVAGQRLGVLAAHLDLRSMDELIDESASLGDEGKIYLVNRAGETIAADRLGIEGYINSEGINNAIQGKDGEGTYRDYEGESVIGVYRWIADRELALMAEMYQEAALAPARQLAWTILLIGVFFAGVLTVGIYLLARQIARPILAITETAMQISTGDLTQQAPVLTEDEIGLLARAFNTMQAKLQQSYQQLEEYAHTLEERVAERTQEAERRAAQIATGAEIARAATALLDPDQLITRVVELIKERFGFYYVGLFILDENNRYAVLRQGTGEPGRVMKERKYRLEINDHSMIGWACAHKQARIALDVGEDPVHFANPLLPDTHSEMALPLRSRERILGALSVQSTKVAAFDDSDVTALQAMADQVAVALENARLFQETQSALHATEALYAAAWDIIGATQIKDICQNLAIHLNNMVQADRTLILLIDRDREEITVRAGYGNLTDELSITYEKAVSGMTSKVLETSQPILVQEVNDELESLQIRQDKANTNAGSIIVAPLMIKGVVGGTITTVKRRDQRHFTSRDVELQTTLAALATTAIENVLLFEQTQKANVDLERRALQLETSSQLGQQVTSILNQDELLNEVVNLIKERFGYYFVAILLLSDKKEHLVLHAGTGEAGKTLREQTFHVNINASNITAQVCATGQYRVINDANELSNYQVPEVLANTRSELALPLRMGNQTIGVLDIHEDSPAAFGSEDKMVLQALADQTAIAIRNAQLYKFEQERRQLAESLQQIGRTLSGTLDMIEVPSRILEQLELIVPYERGAILVQQDDIMQIIAQRGFPEGDRASSLNIPIREGDIYRQLSLYRQPMIVDDVTQISGWQQVEWLPLNKSWMGVPLISKDRAIGMISLTRREAASFSQDETSLVSTFAGQAAIALENARLFDEVKRFNEKLEQMVEQRTAELNKAYKTLEQLDRSKSSFINVTAHELRTPLTVIKGYAQMLELDMERRDANRYLEGILDGTERLSGIVNGMLDVAKIDTQVLNMNKKPTNLAEIVGEVAMGFKVELQERELTLATNNLENLPKIMADPDLIFKVFYHLVVNAIKYTPDKGRITIEGEQIITASGDRVVEIVVSDTGIGIDAEHQELIFEKFYQTGDIALHSSGRTKFKGGGPGLGLAIAKGAVAAHGGKIWVESAGYDEEKCPGSHFHVLLPLG